MDKATKLDALRLADRLYRVRITNDEDLRVILSAEAELRRLAVERDELAARLDALAKQEPISWLSRNLGNGATRQCAKNFAGDCFWTSAFPVYAAPTPAPVADEREATAYVTSDGKMLVFADKVQGNSSVQGMEPLFKRSALQPAQPAQPAAVPEGWKEAAIAWEVCASIHREYAKGSDALFKTRQADFVRHADKARGMLATSQPKENGDAE